MGLPAGISSCPKDQDNSGVAVEETSGLRQYRELAFGSTELKTLDNKLWAVLEDMVCRKCHNSPESLRRSLVKTAAEIPLETERAATAGWLEHLKACVEAQGSHSE